MNKKVLPAIYSAAVWCLFVVLLFFWLYCVTTVSGGGALRDDPNNGCEGDYYSVGPMLYEITPHVHQNMVVELHGQEPITLRPGTSVVS